MSTEKITTRKFPRLEPILEKEYYHTSHKQRHDWSFAHSRQGEEFLFKMIILKKALNLDKRVFNKVFECIIKCNESLRTNFVKVDNRLMQKVNKWNPKTYYVRYIDLYNENNSTKVFDLVKNEELRMIDYETEPLITIYVYRTSKSCYTVAIFIEHIILDALSAETLINEIKNLYNKFSKGNYEFPLPNKIQLKEYTDWRNQVAKRKINLNFWSSKNKNDSYIFNFQKFYDSYGSDDRVKKGHLKGKYTFFIEEDLKLRLSKIANTSNVGFPLFLIGTFAIYLSKIFNQKNLLVSVLYKGREKKEIKDLIANCTDFVFLFIDINEFISLIEMVRIINFRFLTSSKYVYPWKGDGKWPFEKKNLFKINYLPNQSSKNLIQNFVPTHQQVKSKGITSNSYLEFLERSNGIEVLCKYSLCFYSTGMIEFLFSKYLAFIESIINEPNTIIGELVEV